MIATGGQWNRRLSLGAYIAVVGVAGGMALLDEWHQYFVPNRCASVGDVALDSVGIASIIALHAYRRKAREAKPP